MRPATLAPLALLFLLAAPPARADIATATFEGLPTGHTAGFADAGFTFNNNYTAAGDFFTGFAVSNLIDNIPVVSGNTSNDYDHQFGAYAPATPGTGAGGSNTYGIAYTYTDFPGGQALITLPDGYRPVSIDIANTTYAASFLLHGDHFGNPIARGQDFKLEIIGLDAQGRPIAAAPVTVTLADDPAGTPNVRFGFIHVDLTSLVGAHTLGFQIDTTVVDSSGFASAPFTFAVDNVVAATAVPEPSGLLLLAAGAVGFGLRLRRKPAA